MVMATPSPECVGREFVRQYYTLLNEAPLHLHRFYSNNSSFLHGGVDHEEPVIGQADIHKKIMALNFRDCHAKIRQVDSHATLGEGVVVQVTGELSNNGQPMRRFMQTFVLAPQSPKKYYVHNDIFRYQDEVFNDEDEPDNQEGSPVESEGEAEEVLLDSPPVEAVQDPTVTSFYDTHPVSNGTVEDNSQPVQVVAKPAETEEIVDMSPTTTQTAPSPTPIAGSTTVMDSQSAPVTQSESIAQQNPVVVQSVDENHTGRITPTRDEQQQELENPKAPKNWADVARQNTQSNSPTVQGSAPVIKPIPQQPVSPPSKDQNKTVEGGIGRQEPLPQRPPRPSGRGAGRGAPPSGPGEGGMPEPRRGPRYPDSNQVFVGNLPQDINEDELKNHFMEYGNVVEMRINTKSGGGKVPNFGFIVFDDPSSVQRILSEKPIMFRGEHRLNVEEKKARASRNDSRGGKPGDTRPMGTGRGMGGPQGGGRGGGRGSGIGVNKGGGGGGGGGGNRFTPRR
ncbi:ras GTPase-activating protein-binding protein 2-like [Ptychodera flava]|uniref:ras GTPase-activating protein-binding protein 2-like n=1 Tax=Ptychodera flava TaxID=63121 RepID=UPI003969C3AB